MSAEQGGFAAWQAAQLARVERALNEWMPAQASAGLGEVMRYAVQGGGKRGWRSRFPGARCRSRSHSHSGPKAPRTSTTRSIWLFRCGAEYRRKFRHRISAAGFLPRRVC